MNCVNFTGNVVREPELKTTQSGTSYTRNALAVVSGFGENRKTNFFNFTVWGKSAEAFCKYVKKGNRIGIECEAQTNEYTNKDNVKITQIDFRVKDWEFLQSKSESNDATAEEPAPKKSSSKPASTPKSDDSFINIPDGIDEELPFQ